MVVARKEPETREEANSYWYKAYKSMEATARMLEGRVNELEKILNAQIRTNDIIGESMEKKDQLQNDEMNAHDREMQEMGKELMRLRAKVRELGGNLD
jgi:hypothetical protein